MRCEQCYIYYSFIEPDMHMAKNRCHSDMCFPWYCVSRTSIPRDACFPTHIIITRDACFPSVIYVSLYDLGIFMSITNISMYNYMNAAYLAKLMYEISLSSPSFKLRKSLTMRMCSRATLRYMYSLIVAHNNIYVTL